MSPEQEAAFRAALERDTAIASPTASVPQYAPAPGETRYLRGPGTREERFAEALTGTDDSPLSFGDRAEQSGRRLLGNPAVQSALDPTGLYRTGNRIAGDVQSLVGGGRQGTFQREEEGGPQHLELKPMAGGYSPPQPDVAPLSPSYGLNRPQMGAGGMAGMGGAGGGIGGLAADYRQKQNNELGTYNTEKDLLENRGEDQVARVQGNAQLQDLDAARKQRDAEVMAQHEAQIGAKHEAFLARNQQLIDQIGAERIDPSKVLGDKSAGEKFAIILAGALNGFAGNGMQYLKHLSDEVDTGVRAQMANADNAKAGLAARNNLFAQMMQETGDRRVAEQQTRNIIWESAKQKLAANAERLGIPELKTNAQLAMTEIQKRQDLLQTGMSKDALASAQAQAAAAVSAQRAAEDRAWNRGMQVAELGLKKDAQDIERSKLEKGEKDETDKQVQTLGTALADPKLADGRLAVENAKRRLGSGKADEGLPGVGTGADFREKLAGRPQGANQLNPMAWVTNKVAGLDDNERVSRSDWEKIKLSYQHQITGAGASEHERAMINSAFEGNKSPAEQRAAIATADAMFQQVEARHKASVTPRAQQVFADRLNAVQPQMPGSVKVNR